MPAPNGTVWGDVIRGNSSGLQGKLGIYVNKTVSDTKVDVNVQVWFASIYALNDGDGVGNDQNKVLYSHGTNVDEASGDKGEKKIYHTWNTGAGWNSQNQTKVYEENYSHARGETSTTYKIYAQFNGIDVLNHVAVKVNTSYTVDALKSYIITYGANLPAGRTLTNSLPSSQTKYHGKNLTLSSTKPTTTGYTCTGWITNKELGYKLYKFDSSLVFDLNVSTTLYANWVANTYKITYNKNATDATGGKSSDTQTYGTAIKLPTGSDVPTRPNYNFLGWSTSATATEAKYKPGDSYQPNKAVTLYAIWEQAYDRPKITRITLDRCLADGTPDDEGTYCNVSFSWKLYNESDAAAITVSVYDSDSNRIDFYTTTGTAAGTLKVPHLGKSGLSTEYSYTVSIVVNDSVDGTRVTKTLKPIIYPIDVLAGGKGIAFGKPARKSGVMDIGLPVELGESRLFGLGDVLPITDGTDLNNITEPGIYSIQNETILNSLIHRPPTSASITAGRLEVWTAHGCNTDKTSARRHIMQRITSIDGTSIWTRYMRYSNTTGLWTVERDWQNDALRAYPVGSIYIAYNHNDPTDLFGGTWERIINRFLWGVDKGETIGRVDGEENHTLTQNEMPIHQHEILNYNPSGVSESWTKNSVQATDNVGWTGNARTASAGGGQPHNNMPPYITVSIWRRTA